MLTFGYLPFPYLSLLTNINYNLLGCFRSQISSILHETRTYLRVSQGMKRMVKSIGKVMARAKVEFVQPSQCQQYVYLSGQHTNHLI